jgi:hypothetical protein
MLARMLLASAIVAAPGIALAGRPTSPYPDSAVAPGASPSQASRPASRIKGDRRRAHLHCESAGPKNVMVCFRNSRGTKRPATTPLQLVPTDNR